MSKDILIDNNGVEEVWEQIGVVRTRALVGAYEDWVPESECVKADLTITKNGEYVAEDDELYGYGIVTVSVSGSVTGKKNGVTYTITVDGNGDLVETVVGG